MPPQCTAPQPCRWTLPVLWCLSACLGGCATGPTVAEHPTARLATRQQAVADTERAFADALARRDLAAFARFIAPDAVFLAETRTLRGVNEIVNAWKPLFDGPTAPFSWTPDRVEVQQAAGGLALSTGPVRNPQGKVIARYTSTWREESPGVWRIVLDVGADACEAGTK